MATITSSIKPDGGGDYVSIALWEAGIPADDTDNHTARVDEVGDVGGIFWNVSNANSVTLRITVADAYRHRRARNGAYLDGADTIDMRTAECQIDGLRWEGTASFAIRFVGAVNPVVTRCAVFVDAASGSGFFGVIYQNTATGTVRVERNFVQHGGTSYGACIALVVGASTDVECHHNTVRTSAKAAGTYNQIQIGGTTGTLNMYGNVSLGGDLDGSSRKAFSITASGTVNRGYNVSGDSTATGTGSITDIADTAWFEDLTADAQILSLNVDIDPADYINALDTVAGEFDSGNTEYQTGFCTMGAQAVTPAASDDWPFGSTEDWHFNDNAQWPLLPTKPWGAEIV